MCFSKYLKALSLFLVNLREERYIFLGQTKIEEIDPAVRLVIFDLQKKTVKILMILSLHSSGSNGNKYKISTKRKMLKQNLTNTGHFYITPSYTCKRL